MGTPKEPGTPASQRSQSAADPPVWLREWQKLLAADPRNAETRRSEAYRYARAIVTAHPDWGSANVGRALGYDSDTCKKRGVYWRGRLASLGDLPQGAAFSAQRVSPELRAQLELDPAAGQIWAHRNSAKLPPIPPELLAALRATEDPGEAYSLLRKHRRQLSLAHRDTPARAPGHIAPVSGMRWRPALVVGSVALGALAAVVLFTRSHTGR